MADRETLLGPSGIWLFGRTVDDLEIKQEMAKGKNPKVDPEGHDPFVGPRESCNNFLRNQLLCGAEDKDSKPQFARIYGFSYEGSYYDLPWPALFLVHGPGVDAETGHGRYSIRPDNPSRTGLGATDFTFAEGLKAWSYDRADFSMRLDVDSGTFEQILLDLVFGGGGGPSVSGVRVQGVRVSGVRARGVRVSGVRARGGRDGDAGD